MGRSEFGRELQRLRKVGRLRQVDLAQELGMGRSTIANVEAGREPPTPRLWQGLDHHHPGWHDSLVDALAAEVEPASAQVDLEVDQPLGGPFVIESVIYAYQFEEARSPAEIIEVRRVRATADGADRFGLSLRHTRSPGFVVDEQALWGGHLMHRRIVDETNGTRYLRTFHFGRRLQTGERHEFASRSLVERDPTPPSEITTSFSIPVEQASIHLNFHGSVTAEEVWAFGPVAEDDPVPGPSRSNRVALTAGTASAYWRSPRIGQCYGIAWRWAN